MKQLGAILGWKFNHAEGITTIDDEIVEWPEALGDMPTPEQLATWAAEYDTYSQIQALKAQLNAIESARFRVRGEREAWIVDILDAAAKHSPVISEPTLYAANPFYKQLKDDNTLCATLRAQINALGG